MAGIVFALEGSIRNNLTMKTTMKALILVLTLTASAAMAAPAPAPSKGVIAPKKKIANVMKITIQPENGVCISADEFFASKWRRSLPRKKIHSYC
jgi:hypothetical protein